MENLTELTNRELIKLGYLRCSGCSRELLLESMSKNKNSPYNGYATFCKDCNKKKSNDYYYKNREECLTKQRVARVTWTDERREQKHRTAKEYREINIDRLKERSRSWYLNNREGVLARVAIWAAENSAKTKGYKRKYAKANVDKVSLSRKRWVLANPGVRRIHTMRRRAIYLSRTGTVTTSDINTKLEGQNYCCVYCGESLHYSYHVDHIVPITRDFPVQHNSIDNLQMLCPRCNLRKGAKTHLEFLVYCSERVLDDSTYYLLPTAHELAEGSYLY